MAYDDLGDETEDEAGEEQQTTSQTPAIRTGLLSPSTFPLVWADTSQADGPAIAPQSPILSGPLDRDVHAEVLQDILDAQARLPPPASAKGLGASPNGRWLDPPAPQITGPLDSDTRAEVLRDIRNAQTQFPPASPRRVHSSGNRVAPDLPSSSSSYSFGTDGAGGNNGRAQFSFAGSRPFGNAVSSLVFAEPASKLRPLDPNITYIGGWPYRIIDTGKAEQLVPDRVCWLVHLFQH